MSPNFGASLDCRIKEILSRPPFPNFFNVAFLLIFFWKLVKYFFFVNSDFSKGENLVVLSYKFVSKYIETISRTKFNYCVLDEGHVIKNPKSQTSKAVKQVKANHRLILSGTPIQNNVFELWSLFDFLMPGFLGTEKEFNEKYSRPILMTRTSKDPKDQQAGVLALEALHKQVLPFLLRRMKQNVLDELPPKIIQDYFCQLSPLQSRMYEDFERNVGQLDHKSENFLQAQSYIRKLCNHPCTLLTSAHPQYDTLMKSFNLDENSLKSVEHSGKLLALEELLLECGIGIAKEEESEPVEQVSANHRALIFVQMNETVQIITEQLFKKRMPNVTFLTLQASFSPNERFKTVTKFNEDPSIDVLLLTTKIGGLGLNLTGKKKKIIIFPFLKSFFFVLERSRHCHIR